MFLRSLVTFHSSIYFQNKKIYYFLQRWKFVIILYAKCVSCIFEICVCIFIHVLLLIISCLYMGAVEPYNILVFTSLWNFQMPATFVAGQHLAEMTVPVHVCPGPPTPMVRWAACAFHFSRGKGCFWAADSGKPRGNSPRKNNLGVFFLKTWPYFPGNLFV
jgi:hypothetical protein